MYYLERHSFTDESHSISQGSRLKVVLPTVDRVDGHRTRRTPFSVAFCLRTLSAWHSSKPCFRHLATQSRTRTEPPTTDLSSPALSFSPSAVCLCPVHALVDGSRHPGEDRNVENAAWAPSD